MCKGTLIYLVISFLLVVLVEWLQGVLYKSYIQLILLGEDNHCGMWSYDRQWTRCKEVNIDGNRRMKCGTPQCTIIIQLKHFGLHPFSKRHQRLQLASSKFSLSVYFNCQFYPMKFLDVAVKF